MRGIYLFSAGIMLGLIVQFAIAQNQNQNQGIVGLHHVAISVPDLDEAVAYYTETLGFPEAFRIAGDNGLPRLVYVQVSQNTFIELQPANANRPAGISHFGLHVENMAEVTAMFKERGANIGGTRVGSTSTIMSNISDLNNTTIELLELPPKSAAAQAAERWQ